MERKNRVFIIIGLIVLVLLNFSFIVFLHNGWNASMQKYLPLEYELNKINSNLANSHLWLEEALNDDITIDIQRDVFIPLQQQSFHEYLKKHAEDFSSEDELTFLDELNDLHTRLHHFFEQTQKRWSDATKYGTGSKEDQKYDAAYNAILSLSKQIQKDIQKRIQSEIDKQAGYFRLIITFFILANASILFTLLYYWYRQREYERSLFESHEKNQVTLSSIGDAVITTDVHGNITFLNKTAEKMTGYNFEEIEGKYIDDVLDLYNIESGKKLTTPIQKVLYENETKLISNGTMLKSKSGVEYIVSDSAAPLQTSEGEIFGTVLVFQNDTERHRDAQKLNYQYNLLQSVINSTPDLIFYKDYVNKDGQYIGCNKAFEAFAGKSEQEITTSTDMELFSKELASFFREKDKEVLQGKETRINEEWADHANGSNVLLSTLKTPLLGEDGKMLGILGISRDITEGYKLDKELKESHEMLGKLTRNVPGAIYQFKLYPDGRSCFPYASNGIKDVYEVEPKDVVEDAQQVFNVLHPDDYDMIVASIEESAATMNDWSLQYRVNLPVRGLRWLEGHSKPEKHDDGSIVWHGYIHDITEKKEAENELVEQKSILDYQAHHDALTGLPNRVLFHDRLAQSIETAKRGERKVALLFVDLDHFKEINDSLGHNIGDEILKLVTTRLRNAVRRSDTIARLGGDEFTVILEDLHNKDESAMVADKILQSISTPMNVNENLLYLSCSIGISIYPDNGKSSGSLLKFADSAMYKAKDQGRNNYQYYDTTLTKQAYEKIVMESGLRTGIENNEFVVYFQPQVEAPTGKIIGMEALVRWEHPKMGLVSPAKFIPLAEASGFIVQLDRYVMKTAMLQFVKWYEKGYEPGILTMNLSVKQLHKEDFVAMFINLMEETKCHPSWLGLEVTESHIMTRTTEAIEKLTTLSELGVTIAVDDFGTGYSSLSYLKKLPINILKIDREFIRDLPEDEEDRGITTAIIALAKSLNLKVIAEGVESVAQRDYLMTLDCQKIQGFLYSQPVAAGEMEKLLEHSSIDV